MFPQLYTSSRSFTKLRNTFCKTFGKLYKTFQHIKTTKNFKTEQHLILNLYRTLQNFIKLYKKSKTHKTFHNLTERFKTTQHLTQVLKTFTTLYNTLHKLNTTLQHFTHFGKKALQSLTELYNTLQHIYKTHSFATTKKQLFQDVTNNFFLHKALQVFTRLNRTSYKHIHDSTSMYTTIQSLYKTLQITPDFVQQHIYSTFTHVFKTLHKLYNTLQTQLYKTLHNVSQLYTTLHTANNSTTLHTTLHNCTQLFQHTTLYQT